MKKSVLLLFLVLCLLPLVQATPPVAVINAPSQIYLDQFVQLDASSSYDLDNNLPNTYTSFQGKPTYDWYDNFGGVTHSLGNSKTISLNFNELGTHTLILQVTDSAGETAQVQLDIQVTQKTSCTLTPTKYYPSDTQCQDKWPAGQGDKLNINSPGKSCDLIEVCSEDLDYIIEDAIDCCDGNMINTDDPAKLDACQFANDYSKGRLKNCQALFVIKGLGDSAVYMQDYFSAEMCCYNVSSLCDDPGYLFQAKPIPKIKGRLPELTCYTQDKWLSEIKAALGKGKVTPDPTKGWWDSDTDSSQNNNALADIPTHASVNILSTGTCVDYSLALTTLLRKIGFREDQIYTVEATNHAYNLIRFFGDRKYTLVDTTGNNYAIVFGGLPFGYPYCENIRNCYNDNGKFFCPSFNEIYGCQKQNAAQEVFTIFRQATDISAYLGISGLDPTKSAEEKTLFENIREMLD